MLVSVIADGIAMLFMPRASIMTEKLARRGLHIHQEYEADVLQQVKVSETMDPDAPILTQDVKHSARGVRLPPRHTEFFWRGLSFRHWGWPSI